MDFKEDYLEDIKEIKYESDEISNEAVWTSANGLNTDTFIAIIGDTLLHGDEEKNLVSTENVQISGLESDSVVQQMKIDDIITINGIEYEVVNDPFLDSVNGGEMNIPLRRKYQTRI